MDFVVGHPRSGTQFVSELLGAGESGVSEHELLVALAPESIELGTAYHAGQVSADAIAALSRRYSGAPRIDCNWKLAWMLPPLLAAHPAARLVHLVREPRANVRSCVALDYYGALVDDPRFQTDPERNRWLRALPHLDGGSQLERNCHFWNRTHALIAAAPIDRSRHLLLRLEDLRTEGAIERLFAFLEVSPPSPVRLREVRQTAYNAKEQEKREVDRLRPRPWTDEDDRLVWRLCGETARGFGYEGPSRPEAVR
jgi:hypothetical protein